jgi:hypothetical protein
MIPVNNVYKILVVGNLLGIEFSRSFLHTDSNEGVSTKSYYGCIHPGGGCNFVDAGVVIRFTNPRLTHSLTQNI